MIEAWPKRNKQWPIQTWRPSQNLIHPCIPLVESWIEDGAFIEYMQLGTISSLRTDQGTWSRISHIKYTTFIDLTAISTSNTNFSNTPSSNSSLKNEPLEHPHHNKLSLFSISFLRKIRIMPPIAVKLAMATTVRQPRWPWNLTR